MIGRSRRIHREAASRRTLPRHHSWALVAALATVLAIAEPAGAEVQPTLQARVANAEFLAYAPPPPKPAAVCLIDSGVDLNPDTEPLIAERISLDGGSGDDVLPSKHGTQMAMVMGAPANGWGMVGIWPYLKIVSVRATPAGQEGFEFRAYRRGLEECRLRAARYGIKAAELALGGAKSPTQDEESRLLDMVQRSQAAGLSVVAAAGNSGGDVEAPASVARVFAVAAGDAAGSLCAFSSRGPAIDVVAPGCAVDQALPADGSAALGEGSSQASAIVASTIAALRAYAPTLGPEDAERLVLSATRQTAGGLLIDAAQLFRTAGLGSLVDIAPNEQAEQVDLPIASVDVSPPTERRLPTPRLRHLRLRGGGLALSLRSRPVGAVMVISVHWRRGRRARQRTYERLARSFSLRAPRWSFLTISFQDRYGSRADSLAVRIGYPTKRGNS